MDGNAKLLGWIFQSPCCHALCFRTSPALYVAGIFGFITAVFIRDRMIPDNR